MAMTNDAPEVDRIFRFLTREGPRHGLAIVIHADRVLAGEARARLIADVQAKRRRVATLELLYDDDRQDLVQRMIDVSAGADALFVVGLDRLVTDVLGRPRPTTAIINLNLRRDELAKVLDVRVVFWVAKSAYSSLLDVAPDLCRVMTTTAELEATRAIRIEPSRVEEPPAWLQLAPESEFPGLEQKLQSLIKQYDSAPAPRVAADAAASAANVVIRLGRVAEGRTWLERAVEAHVQAGQLGEAAMLARRAGEMALFAGDLDQARRHAERACVLARQADDPLEGALGRALIAEVDGRRGDVEAAIRVLESEVLPTLVRLGNAKAQAEVLAKIADFHEVRGELDQALRLREDRIAPLYEQESNRLRAPEESAGQHVNVDRIANLRVRKGDLDVAAEFIAASPSPSATRNLAAIAEARGDLDASSALRVQNEQAAEPDTHSQARVLGSRAQRLQGEGKLDPALQIRREELAIYERLGDIRGQVVTLGEIADLLVALRRQGEATRVLLEQMGPRAEQLGDFQLRALAYEKELAIRRGANGANRMWVLGLATFVAGVVLGVSVGIVIEGGTQKPALDAPIAGCEIVTIETGDSRTSARLLEGETQALAHHTVVCSRESRDVRIVVERLTGAVHMFNWPMAPAKCASTFACIESYLSCTGHFTCFEHDSVGCIRGQCIEASEE